MVKKAEVEKVIDSLLPKLAEMGVITLVGENITLTELGETLSDNDILKLYDERYGV